MTPESITTMGAAVVGLGASVLNHFRVRALPNKIKAEIQADALKAAALMLAESVLAAAKIKADAVVAAEKIKAEAKSA
jgi:hypothetical protein